MNLVFEKQYHGENTREKITYMEALKTLLGTYRDTDLTHDFLTVPNRIPCTFSTVYVTRIDGGKRIVPLAGMEFCVPDGNWYDDDGNRI